jgi:hypothetical protein
MAKIKLLVKTDSNINELKRKEIQAIDWDSFPYEEQIGFVDTETYNKLTIAGRRHIDRALKNYTDKPVEFWNVVAEHNELSLATKLWRSATLETKGIMLANHAKWFAPFLYSYKLDTGEEDRNSITALITEHGDHFENELDDYLRFADPSIAFAEFNAPFTMKGSSFPSLLHYIYEVLEDAYEHDEYPVLVHNHMLKTAGYSPICDLSSEFLARRDACDRGSRIAKKWIRTVTNGEKDFITWDEAVNYIRANPESFENNELMEHLSWWWTNAILGGT